MTITLTEAISNLQNASASARAIIEERLPGFASLSADGDSVSPDDVDELVAKLVETVDYQSKLIDSMTDQLSVETKDFSGDVEEFASRIRGADAATLVLFYDKEILKPLKQETRAAVCRVLIDYATEKKAQPSALWLSIVSNHGILGE